jgi:hypothetical protein
MRWAHHVARIGVRVILAKLVWGNLWKTPNCKTEEVGLREEGCEDGRWIDLAQDRVQWRGLV